MTDDRDKKPDKYAKDEDGKIMRDALGNPILAVYFESESYSVAYGQDGPVSSDPKTIVKSLKEMGLERLIPDNCKEKQGDALIDPPVGPYNTTTEIKAWIAKLETMPESEDRDFAMEQAKQWLNR